MTTQATTTETTGSTQEQLAKRRRAKSASRSAWRLALPYIPLVVLLFLALFARQIAPYDPVRTVASVQQPPSRDHFFGVDAVGMDVFSRSIAGVEIAVRIGMTVAIVSTVLGLLIGTFIGLVESSRKSVGVLGRGLNKLSEYVLATPSLVLGIVVVGLMGASDTAFIVALTLALMQPPIRLTRAEVLRVRKEAYLEAAELAGNTSFVIAMKHVLPNSMRPALVNMPIIFGNSIIVLAGLGFIGVGAQPPTPEWGSMISTGISSLMLGYWWASTFPAICLFIAVMSVSYSARGIQADFPEIVRRARAYKVRVKSKKNHQHHER